MHSHCDVTLVIIHCCNFQLDSVKDSVKKNYFIDLILKFSLLIEKCRFVTNYHFVRNIVKNELGVVGRAFNVIVLLK